MLYIQYNCCSNIIYTYKDIEINESAQLDKPISTPLAIPGTIIEKIIFCHGRFSRLPVQHLLMHRINADSVNFIIKWQTTTPSGKSNP